MGSPHEREPDINGPYPDSVVATPAGRVVLEVHDPELIVRNRAGAYDPVGPIRHGLTGSRKKKQVAAVKAAGLPYVLVTGTANSSVGFRPEFEGIGALSGRLGFSFPIGGSEPPPGDAVVYGYNDHDPRRAVRTSQNRGISALAFISEFNPTAFRLHAEWRRRGLTAQAQRRLEERTRLERRPPDAGRSPGWPFEIAEKSERRLCA